MSSGAVEQRVREFEAQGVVIVDPRQTFIDADVRVDRVRPGATLHPGARLHGARTFLAAGAQVGTEGPATVRDAVFGEDASIAAGFVSGAVLLRGANLGHGAHVRAGTLLEEEASTAHCVGLKHSILLSFVTLGSLINFCDVLMAGGTSRKNHSEVGSGFIHFNFTPWGERGDKATPSLLGDVPRGVFLRNDRIFLGGAGGLVGPGRVGFGGITGAGQVVRKPVAEGTLSLQPIRALTLQRGPEYLDSADPRAARNVAYIAQVVALREWYRQVRRPGAAQHPDRAPVVAAAIETLGLCIAERVKRLASFLAERGASMPHLDLEPSLKCPLSPPSGDDHVAWVRALSEADAQRGTAWLQAVAEHAVGTPMG